MQLAIILERARSPSGAGELAPCRHSNMHRRFSSGSLALRTKLLSILPITPNPSLDAKIYDLLKNWSGSFFITH